MEDQFKNKLKDLQVKWDKESLWEKMEPQLPQPKSNWRKYFLLCLGLFALLAMGLWAYQNNDANTQATDQSNNDTEENIERKISKGQLATASENNKDKNIKADNDQTKQTQNFNPNGASSTSKFETTDAIQIQEVIQDKARVGNMKISENKILSKSPASTKQNENPFSNNNSFSLIENNIKPDFSLGTTPFDKAQFNSANSTVNTHIPDLSTTGLKRIEPMSSLETLPISTILLTREKREFSNPDLVFPSEIPRPIKFYFELTAGLGRSTRNISLVNSDHAEISVINDFKAFENQLFNTSLEGRVGMRFKSNIFISSGINLENFYEIIDWQKRSDFGSDVIYNYEKAFYELDVNGDSTFYAGPVRINRSSNQNLLHYNRLRFFNIPIAVGYQRDFGRLGLAFSAGVHFSFGSKLTGRAITLDEEDQPLVVADPETKVTKRFGWQGSLGGSFALSKKTAILLNVGIKNHGEIKMDRLLLNYLAMQGSIGIRRDLY